MDLSRNCSEDIIVVIRVVRLWVSGCAWSNESHSPRVSTQPRDLSCIVTGRVICYRNRDDATNV